MKEEPTNPLSPFFRSNARDLRGQRAGIPIRVPAQRRLGFAEIRVERDFKELQLEVVIVVRPHAHLEAGAEVQVAAQQQQQPQVGIPCRGIENKCCNFLFVV